MDSSSKHPYLKSFQRIESEIVTGPWTITPYIDPVSEKKYLFFSLNSKLYSLLHPTILAFRGDAAVEIAPRGCHPVQGVKKEKGQVAFFIPYARPCDPHAIESGDLEGLFDTLLKTLARFEHHDFAAMNLSLDTIGRNEDGTFCLLPSAYILPFQLSESDETFLDETIAAANIDRLINRRDDTAGHHLRGMVRIFEQMGTITGKAGAAGDAGDIHAKLSRALKMIKEDPSITLAGLYRLLLGDALDPAFTRPVPGGGRVHPDWERQLRQIEAVSGSGGHVVLVEGAMFSGKSAFLRAAASTLAEAGMARVSILNEWELFRRSRRGKSANQPAPPDAILVDNLDERAFIYSDLATDLLKEGTLEDTLVILSVDPDRLSKEAEEFLRMIEEKAGEGFLRLPLPRRDAVADAGGDTAADPRSAHLSALIDAVSPGFQAGDSATPVSLAAELLSQLRDEEKQLLEFIAISRFAMPIEIALSLFHERGNKLRRAVQRLAALDLVEIRYRYHPERDSLWMLLSMKRDSIGRLIYMSIPPQRRKNLSKTIPLLVEEHGSFPPFHFLYHLLKGDERSQAAKFCVNYFKNNKAEARPFFFTVFTKELVENGLFEILPAYSQIFILKELAGDLLNGGDTTRAEELLRTAIAILENTDTDEQTQHAQLITETALLLADIWEARGRYTTALDLLSGIKDTLQAYLSIPDQARLVNDIGWLQYRLGDYERSVESCKLSLTSVNRSEYPLVVAQALNTMGVVHFNTSRYDEAISYYERSASLREQSDDLGALSASYNNLGLAHQTKGEYQKALDYYTRSLEIKEQQRNQAGLAAGSLNLALLYLEMRNFTEAEQKCSESLRISEQVGNLQLTAENYSTLGDIALMRDEQDRAEDYYQQSRVISQKIETINLEMGALRRLAQLYLIQSRHEEALEVIARASELGRRIGSKLETAQINMVLGDLKSTQKKNMEAIDHYEKAANSFTTLSKYRLAAIALSKIGLIHAGSGNTLEARQCLDRGLDLARSDIGHEYPKELTELQHTLRTSPLRPGLPDETTEKLLMAFYELSTLSDYALDRNDLFKKLLEIVKQLIDPEDCKLAIKVEESTFQLYDCDGETAHTATPGEAALFSRTLLLGCLLETSSPDVFTILSELKIPEGQGFVSIPLKSMGEDLGCLYLFIERERLPLSKEHIAFMTSLGRHAAGNLRLMFHFEEHLYPEKAAETERTEPAATARNGYHFEHFISESKQMKDILKMLDKIKDKTPNILFIGESGTGKTQLARAIHYNSPRRGNPFQPIHCAQIPDTLIESELFGYERGAFTGAYQRKMGLCEAANGGTIFLDDVNAVPLDTQKKLLNFLEMKTFNRVGGTKTLKSDVRIIAASNEDLEKLCKEGRFREDLYFRLQVILVNIPPLRERKEDIIAITKAFMKKRCGELGIPLKTLAPDTMRLFQRAPWRGNVRELQNVLERVLLLTDDNVIHPDSLPGDVLREVSGIDKHRTKNMRALISEIIQLENYSEGNPLMPQLEALFAKLMVDHVKAKGKAASLLGITKPTLYTRLGKYSNLEK